MPLSMLTSSVLTGKHPEKQAADNQRQGEAQKQAVHTPAGRNKGGRQQGRCDGAGSSQPSSPADAGGTQSLG